MTSLLSRQQSVIEIYLLSRSDSDSVFFFVLLLLSRNFFQVVSARNATNSHLTIGGGGGWRNHRSGVVTPVAGYRIMCVVVFSSSSCVVNVCVLCCVRNHSIDMVRECGAEDCDGNKNVYISILI